MADEQERDAQGRFASSSGAAHDASKSARATGEKYAKTLYSPRRQKEDKLAKLAKETVRAHDSAAQAHATAAEHARAAGKENDAKVHESLARQEQRSAEGHAKNWERHHGGTWAGYNAPLRAWVKKES